MKKKRVLSILVSAVFLISAAASAGIVKSDFVAKWAAQAGAGKTSFSFIVFGDNRATSPARSLPGVLKVILKEIAPMIAPAREL